MRALRIFLVLGGIFNVLMGTIFYSNRLLAAFFHAALRLELNLFHHSAVLFVPQDPVHLLLIHGFGAGALILGATLIFSARDPLRWIAFILFDGVGRVIYGLVMMLYVSRFSLPRVIVLFGGFELMMGLIYVLSCWRMGRLKSGTTNR